MQLTIRQERPSDFQTVAELTKAAFRDLELSDHTEHLLIHRLRNSKAFVPELSLVAEMDGELVGHILFTKVIIRNAVQEFEVLSLAPVSVRPEFQRRGIGSSLIENGHAIARNMGFNAVLLVGHPQYYPRFDYRKSSDFGIIQPFDAPDEACMALELVKDGLKGVTGEVVYQAAFFE